MKALFVIWEDDPREDFLEMIRIYEICHEHNGNFFLEYLFDKTRDKYYFLYRFEIPGKPLKIIFDHE